MANTYSFDIESNYDVSEFDHALDQARRELSTRYDFKGSSAALDYSDANRTAVVLTGDNDYQLDALLTMLRTKLAKRGIDQKVLDASQAAEQSGMVMKQTVTMRSGIEADTAKKISKHIRDFAPKAKPQIQGDVVRVTAAKKDELQAIISDLREQDFDIALQFVNYR